MANFDPQTGREIKKGPPPINTRVMLYHPERDPIVIEGKGDTDAEKRVSAQKQIAERQEDGYTRERHHGQHPHSNDRDRLDMQKRAAARGDKKAIAALKAKGHLKDEPKAEAKKET